MAHWEGKWLDLFQPVQPWQFSFESFAEQKFWKEENCSWVSTLPFRVLPSVLRLVSFLYFAFLGGQRSRRTQGPSWCMWLGTKKSTKPHFREIRLSTATALQVNQTLSNGGSSLNEVSKRNIDSTKYNEILKRVMKTRWRNSCVGLGWEGKDLKGVWRSNN